MNLPTTLIDTGPLVALIDKGDRENHRKCAAAFRSLKSSLITTWPCLTEALYFLGGIRGWQSQVSLWRFVERGALRLHNPQPDEWQRIRALMEQYRDTPMDLADASLVSLAELGGLKRIFTLDDDFYVYRINGKEAFELIPLDPAKDVTSR